MNALYVCHFSNGAIKVGRSDDPKTRIAAHTSRVSCVGVELVEHRIFECEDSSLIAEGILIAKCALNASARRQREWFLGLTFQDVCSWAGGAASQTHEKITPLHSPKLIPLVKKASSGRYQCAWDGHEHFWIDTEPHLPHWPDSAVMRWDLRHDWHEIWPELIDHPCAIFFAPTHPHRSGGRNFADWVKSWPVGVQVDDALNSLIAFVESNGQVTRKDLRPDDWESIWPELADKKAA